VPYLALGIALAFFAAGAWLWWTGARREQKGTRAARREATTEDEGLDFATVAGTVVVLRDNFWDDCVFDGIKEDWRRFASRGVRGFYGVPPGRHQAITTVGAGAAVLDFVLYPGEIYVRRLDHETKLWAPDEAETAEKYRALARGGATGAMAGALVGYRVVLGLARATRGDAIVNPDDAYAASLASLERLLERARKDEPARVLLDEAYAAGRALIGAPLTLAQLKALTGAVGVAVSLEGMAGSFKRGALMASIGLAILPDDPYLLEQLATMLCDGGVADEAERAIDKALERAGALDEDALARARATKAEILVRLGRADEARAIVDELVAKRPADTNAARVKGLVYEKIAN
jgi:tetratricopeptide (TPR) repeat protein